MISRLFKSGALSSMAAWLCLGFITYPFGSAFIWALIAPFYLMVLVARLVMLLIPKTRDKVSLKFMWIGPAVFLALLPLYVHRFHTAREAGNQVAKAVEAYKQLHGAYPANGQLLGLDSRPRRTPPFIFYNGSDGRPFLSYASPLMVFDTYSFDFDNNVWIYKPD
jgi:hypothetical protein